MTGDTFEWINTGADGQVKDEGTRRRIRAQAMKKAAAERRNNGYWGKQNLRQLPVFVKPGSRLSSQRARDAPQAGTIDHRHDGSADTGCQSCTILSLGRPMPLYGLERLTADIGVNILDLEELTSLHIGQIAGAMLGAQSRNWNLAKLMSYRRQSYLTHLPSRYGNCPCLDDALRCVALRARRVLIPTRARPVAEEYILHARALKSLQLAVNGAESWYDSDVLCAIQVLGLFEVLDFSDSTGWEKHINGAARLMRLRGPSGFNTEFDKSLLVSMVGPLVCECIRTKQPCFLDEEPWQQLLWSVIVPDQVFTTRSFINVSLWSLSTPLPRLLRDVAEVILDGNIPSPTYLDHLEARIRKMYDAVIQWGGTYKALLLSHPKADRSATRVETDRRLEIRAAGLGVYATACRLLGSITYNGRVALEEESVSSAKQMHRIVVGDKADSRGERFRVSHKAVIADAILKTTDEWLRKTENPGRLIEDWKFRAWFEDLRAWRFRGEHQFEEAYQ